MNTFIRLLYSLLVAASAVAFIGVGIFSFYQPPKEPHYPNYSCSYPSYSSPAANAAYDKCDKAYNKANDLAQKKSEKNKKHYQRNVTIAALPLAAISLVGGILLIRRSEVIGEGLALGGAATGVYAIITSSIADARILRFLSVTLVLLSVLLVAHFRFSTKSQKPKA